MSQLRQEFKKAQQKKDEVVSEAALYWLKENVIVINEKINRSSVNRLISSINKFENTFGPYKSRIPEIAKILDGAESNLQSVLTGRAGDKRASDMLEYLSFVYNVFSTFFSKDLPVIMTTKLFAAPKMQPEVRLDSISDPEGAYNPEMIRKALAHGINPSSQERKLMSKILRIRNMSKLDGKKIARQLMSLSYNDLQDLTNVGKVPLVTTPKTEEELSEGKAPSSLNEQQFDQQKAQALNQKIKQLIDAVKPKAGQMPKTVAALQRASKEMIGAQAQEKPGLFGRAGQAAKKLFLGGGVEEQVLNLYRMFFNAEKGTNDLVELAQNVREAESLGVQTEQENQQAATTGQFQDPDAKPDQQQAAAEEKVDDATKILTRTLSNGLARVQGQPWLTPEDFAKELMAVGVADLGGMQNLLGALPKDPPESLDPTPGTQGQTKAPAAANVADQSTGSSIPSNASGADPSGATAPSGQNQNQIVSDVLAAANLTNDPKAQSQASAFLKALADAGYKVTK